MIVNGCQISNVIDSINSNCLYKRKGWFKRHMEKGFFIEDLYINSDIEKVADTLEGMVKSLNTIYKENWAFFFKDEHLLPELHILFPIIDITNSRGQHHTIRDLVVKLSMETVYGGKIFLSGYIKGIRLTVSKPEFISGYRHSHLHTINYRRYDPDFTMGSDFCMGTNEIPEIATVFNDNQEIGTFELLLLTLETMVSWESIEGVPYINIGSISSRVASDEPYSWSNTHVQKVFSCIVDKNFLKTCNFDMRENRVRIIEDDAFQEKLLSKVIENCPEVVCMRDKYNFDAFLKAKIENHNPTCPNKYFKFKNENIHFKIYDNRKKPAEEKYENINFIIHPTVYVRAIKQVNKYIYEKCVKEYAIENRR